MSELYTITKFGDRRTVERRLQEGYEYATSDGTLTLNEDCLVDVVQEYRRLSTREGYWGDVEAKWDTIRPVRPTRTTPRRRWWHFFRRSKLPEARVVNG